MLEVRGWMLAKNEIPSVRDPQNALLMRIQSNRRGEPCVRPTSSTPSPIPSNSILSTSSPHRLRGKEIVIR